MKIAISREYSELAEELSLRGYDIFLECNEYEGCDIIICNLKNDDLNKYNFGVSLKRDGILIIDKGNKSILELEKIIKGRICSFNEV